MEDCKCRALKLSSLITRVPHMLPPLVKKQAKQQRCLRNSYSFHSLTLATALDAAASVWESSAQISVVTAVTANVFVDGDPVLGIYPPHCNCLTEA